MNYKQPKISTEQWPSPADYTNHEKAAEELNRSLSGYAELSCNTIAMVWPQSCATKHEKRDSNAYPTD